LPQHQPPFRAEHIGSLLRPQSLLDLRAKFLRGEVDRETLTQAENEQALGRVYGGLHFLEGCTAGLRMGNQVADWVYSRHLQP